MSNPYYTGRHENLWNETPTQRDQMLTDFELAVNEIRSGREAYEPHHVIRHDGGTRGTEFYESSGFHSQPLSGDFKRPASCQLDGGQSPREDVDLKLKHDPWRESRVDDLDLWKGQQNEVASFLPALELHRCAWEWNDEVAMWRCSTCGQFADDQEPMA